MSIKSTFSPIFSVNCTKEIFDNRKIERIYDNIKRGIIHMKVAVTGSLKAGENAPIIYRGDFKSIFPMMREDGFGAVELHLRDSREIDRKNWIMN